MHPADQGSPTMGLRPGFLLQPGGPYIGRFVDQLAGRSAVRRDGPVRVEV